MSDENEKGRKKRNNPWGQNDGGRGQGKGRRNSPWGQNDGGGGRHQGGGGPNDLDDFLKNAQDGLREVLPGNMGGGIALLLILLVAILLWLASGFYIVNPGEHGVIQRFGAWSRTKVDEGLGYHFPSPIEKMTKVEVTKQQSMNIGFSEAVTSSRGSVISPARRINDESLMLTSDRNIIELQMTIQWDIKSAEDYLFQIQDQENTIKKVAESAIREVVGQTEMFPIITTGRDLIAVRVKDIIQKNLDEYNSGVNIKQVLIDRAEVHPDVQQAFQDVQSAYQIAEETQNRAEAEREKIIPTARGQATQLRQEAEAYKQSKIAEATGDAERFRLIYQAYLSGKDVTKERIYIETMEQVLGNAQKIIMDSNDGQQGVVPYVPLDALKTKNQSQ